MKKAVILTLTICSLCTLSHAATMPPEHSPPDYVYDQDALAREVDADPNQLVFLSLHAMEQATARLDSPTREATKDEIRFYRDFLSILESRQKQGSLNECYTVGSLTPTQHSAKDIHRDYVANSAIQAELTLLAEIEDVTPGWDRSARKPGSLVTARVLEVLRQPATGTLAAGDTFYYQDSRADYRLANTRQCTRYATSKGVIGKPLPSPGNQIIFISSTGLYQPTALLWPTIIFEVDAKGVVDFSTLTTGEDASLPSGPYHLSELREKFESNPLSENINE